MKIESVILDPRRLSLLKMFYSESLDVVRDDQRMEDCAERARFAFWGRRRRVPRHAGNISKSKPWTRHTGSGQLSSVAFAIAPRELVVQRCPPPPAPVARADILHSFLHHHLAYNL